MPAKEYNTLWYSVCSEISQVVDTENNFKLKINMNKSDWTVTLTFFVLDIRIFCIL